MVYQVEKTLKEHGDKISGDERTQVETAIADAKKALEGTDAAAMNSAREKLTQASHKLAEVMYKATEAPPPGGPGSSAGAGPQTGAPAEGAGQQGKKDEGVIDAEYVDVEDRK
jgi:molecular chaperone DnaK